MKIHYQDEYGEELYVAYNKNAVSRIGETVVIDKEEYRVKDVIWDAASDDVIVEVTQNPIRRAKEPTEVDGRLKEVQRAIVETNKRQDLQEKRTKSLREQTMSIRQHIRQNQPKPKDAQ